MRIALGIEYAGCNYYGWQTQSITPTIQETIELALSEVANEKVIIHCAGRTDTGVHAIQQVVHFETSSIRKSHNWVLGVNSKLPKDISVLWALDVDDEFHARYSAKERIYVYLIQNRLSPSTLNNNREWHIRKKLDINLIKKGSKKLVGTNDFSTFRASNCTAKSPIRTINAILVSKSKNCIKLKFKSKSFLKNQVRSMVGCLKYLGEKKWDLKKFQNIIIKKDRNKVAPPAPACGLYLEKILY